MKSSCQLNVRVPEETLEKFNQIVEVYRSSLQLGKVSKGEIFEHLIDLYYSEIIKMKKAK